MEKNIKIGDIEIQKQKFHKYKESISIKNIDIDKIVVSNKTSFGKEGFNPNLGEIFWGSFWVWGSKITPCLKLVRIMLETWNMARRYTDVSSFRKYTF